MLRKFKWCLIFLFCLYLSPTHGSEDSVLKKIAIAKNNSHLLEYANVVRYMVTKFIGNYTNTLIIMETCAISCDEHRLYHTTVLRYLLDNLNYTLAIQLFFGYPDDRPWDYNMLLVASYWDFEALRFRIPENEHERQFYIFIVLTWFLDDQASYYDDLYGIFCTCHYFNIKNVIIMNKPLNQNYFSFFSYSIYATDQCNENVTIEEINRYENGQLQKPFLFPDHQNNFHGCSLTICGHVIPPLIIFNGDANNEEHLKDIQRLRGIEGDILKLVARTMNLKLQLRLTPNTYSEKDGSRNSTGCFIDLEQNLAHMAIGGLSPLMSQSYKFSISYAHHTSPYVFIIRGGRPFGPIKQLLRPLEPKAWLAILLQLVISIVAIEMVLRFAKPSWRNFIFGPHNRHPIRNLFVSLMGNPLPSCNIPGKNFARFILMAWLLWCFELRNFYQGKLFDSLRLVKRAPSPRTIGELIERDYHLLTFFRSDLYPENKTEIVRNRANRLDLVNQSERHLTATAMLDYLAHYNMMHWNSTSLTYVEETIYNYHCVMFFPKHSMLLASFNSKFKMLSDAGITSHIGRKYIHPYFYNTKANMHARELPQISHKNLAGLYYIYAGMSVFSMFVFILELLSKCLGKLKGVLDYLH